MTVKCKKTCQTAESWKSEFEVDYDLTCLECLLGDHVEGYVDGKSRGFLEIEKKDV